MAMIESQRQRNERMDPRFKGLYGIKRQHGKKSSASVTRTLVERRPLTLEEKQDLKRELLKISTLSSPATKTPPTDVIGCTSPVKMSPKRGLREAMLRSRFADTIFRAQQTLLDHDKKTTQETQTLEEKARIEAETRAAQEASQMRAEEELNMQRARAREAARIEIEKVTNTANFNDAQAIMRDFEALIQGPQHW